MRYLSGESISAFMMIIASVSISVSVADWIDWHSVEQKVTISLGGMAPKFTMVSYRCNIDTMYGLVTWGFIMIRVVNRISFVTDNMDNVAKLYLSI